MYEWLAMSAVYSPFTMRPQACAGRRQHRRCDLSTTWCRHKTGHVVWCRSSVASGLSGATISSEEAAIPRPRWTVEDLTYSACLDFTGSLRSSLRIHVLVNNARADLLSCSESNMWLTLRVAHCEQQVFLLSDPACGVHEHDDQQFDMHSCFKTA